MQPNSNGDLSFMDLLKARGITPADVAKVLDIRERSVYHWLSGRSEPHLTIPRVKALCALLQCSIEDLPDSFARKPRDNEEN